ncbi:MAG: SDR family oxidoreductase [Saprospirales bacterium]|jgi:3-oxoacyl-[acyl-carrier protein] reductase|nr:SDR family oxidoreductase [Saprospirales bacterium]
MSNKTYLIAGGSSGIGLELVKKLSAAGNQVVVLSRNSDSLARLSNVSFLPKNILTDDLAEGELPDMLDGVAYCPGSINLKPFRSLKPDAFLEDFQINVLGAVKVLQASQKAMKNAGKASVVLFSTVAVGQGMPFHTSIAAAKGAVEGLARSLAAEWAPTIRVNCIAPSLTDTPLAARLLNSDDKKEAAGVRHPLKRVGTAAEVASLAYFLLSESAAWMTGQVIGLDGGMSSLKV